MKGTGLFRFSVDRGGTFTDVYAEVPGEPGFCVIKLLSEDPANYPDAPREGIRRILEEVTGVPVLPEAVPTEAIEWIRMGTTVATNALLERKGAPTALVVTRGFRDVLQIGNQDRPRIFDLEIRKPDLLYTEVVEADERLRFFSDHDKAPPKGPEGPVVTARTGDRLVVRTPLDEADIRAKLAAVRGRGIESLAVVLLHAYAWPDHEERIGAIARELGFSQVSLSSSVMPRIKLVPRGDTTLVDAYLTPHIRNYLHGFKKGFKGALKGETCLFMQSDGGLTSADSFTGSRAILSGPAGGVVGYAMTTGREEGNQPVIGFDMGGTSTDVSRYGGEYDLTFETETAGVRIQAPQLNIRTVAAGGGSRLFFEDGMFLVGPESAGAHPGPVCYRKNGYVTVTDANLVLGRIQPEHFPRIFGETEDLPLDREASFGALSELTDRVNAFYAAKGQPGLSVEEVALGFIRVANEVMVRPIREISVMRGFYIKDHVLAAFGGAGPQHACAVARALGMSRVFVHRFSSVLSAYGMGMADVVTEKQTPVSAEATSENQVRLDRSLDHLEGEAVKELVAKGFSSSHIQCTRYLNLRYRGTDTALMVTRPERGDYVASFLERYSREFGFTLKGRKIVVDDLRVRARGKVRGARRQPMAPAKGPASPLDHVTCRFESGVRDTPLYRLDDLGPGASLRGPGLIIHETTTIVVEPGCTARVSPYGDVEIDVGVDGLPPTNTSVDPVRLSIFSNLFMSIAEQMGRMLQKTAVSTNIKERLDFSCALFGPHGELVANAPHLPVHLGAMSEAVKAQILMRGKDLKEGDVLVSNDPGAGGSHLPDITVITPVFRDGKIIFWVASRGHHADIGGISPGSMPPHSKTLGEEGARIISFKLVENGVFQEEGIRELLMAPAKAHREPGSPPVSGTRLLEDNLSDLRAQVAANQKGIALVLEMVDHDGLYVIQAYMAHVQNAAEEAVRQRLKELSLKNGMAEVDTVRAMDHLDDGSPISLALTIDRRQGSARFDFTGTGPEVWGNVNAPKAVTTSAILYCLRCLIQKDLPLNHGCLVPIEIHIPEGSLLAPSPDAAVVGGNVLTSQRITDVVLKAFGTAAASQGCMNNLTFGNETFGYYETIGGGAGAGPTWDGQSGVHTHMTNTRITDPEILERRYPVLLREFSIRKGSGGRGVHTGGDGLIRDLEFLAPLDAAILSERRVFSPYGLKGGEPGKPGQNLLIRTDGSPLNLGSKNQVRLTPGQRLRILTPGGGGYGDAD
ncbi:hydantoinase b/oxoprolinase [Desulfoluna butyratoxydans]|uniref:Hydantoinase b/oxoprolinase n=2 Tax=Desulfoluna butyratoxydans TaxID=231438 RepID=A0A4U8YSA1_9BACT|nr:hydantoinase b/oxoprolinase [Desulfoluna butyratoxydans]